MVTEAELHRGREVTVEGHGDGKVIQAEGDWVRVEFEGKHSEGVSISKVSLRG